MYEELKAALMALEDIPFAEYEWATRPSGNHGTIQLDFDGNSDNGDDHHQDQAREGSVDIFTTGRRDDIAAEVEAILEEFCGASWELNSTQTDNRMLHREYVFQIEVV